MKEDGVQESVGEPFALLQYERGQLMGGGKEEREVEEEETVTQTYGRMLQIIGMELNEEDEPKTKLCPVIAAHFRDAPRFTTF